MNQELLLACSKYVGVPYVNKGRSPTGWDCFGLYWWVSWAVLGVVGMPSYDDTYAGVGMPGRDASVALAIRANAPLWQRRAGPGMPGDCAVFLLGGAPTHCGMVIGGGNMLHCLQGRDTVIENYTTAGWSRRIEGFYKWNS